MRLVSDYNPGIPSGCGFGVMVDFLPCGFVSDGRIVFDLSGLSKNGGGGLWSFGDAGFVSRPSGFEENDILADSRL